MQVSSFWLLLFLLADQNERQKHQWNGDDQPDQTADAERASNGCNGILAVVDGVGGAIREVAGDFYGMSACARRV